MAESHIIGCILGTAVGDALGLPYEGVSRQRWPRLLGSPDRYRFLFRRGMASDDTEHTCLIAQSLIASNANEEEFTRDFARRLRWWFLTLPAGIGRATLRSCLKLWVGVSPRSSGVFSAGNGPAMRSAIIGAVFDDIDTVVAFVRISARITHSDPKAEYGAIAVALAAFHARQTGEVDAQEFFDRFKQIVGDEGSELTSLVEKAVRSASLRQTTLDFAADLGLKRGVTGYTYHTVPIAIHAWLSHPTDYRAAVTSVIECGGDTDTTAAIVGGIVGTKTGEAGIPIEWINGFCDWPATVDWMRRLAQQLSRCATSSQTEKPIALNMGALLLRNLLFLVVVLMHGFRRLLPPY